VVVEVVGAWVVVVVVVVVVVDVVVEEAIGRPSSVVAEVEVGSVLAVG